MSKKSFRVGCPVGVGQICEVDRDQVGKLGGFDVRVKLLDVHDDGLGDRDVQRGCSRDNANCSLIKTGWKL